MKASIVIRTYNEEKHLGALLQGIKEQECDGLEREVVIVDSGSNDSTLDIAGRFDTRIACIEKDDFSFGRSLNLGCEVATGDALVFISGHCIPASKGWLKELVAPLGKKDIGYIYGRQVGDQTSRFSEQQIFAKYYPPTSEIPQQGYYCNNANAALLKEAWQQYPFDEELTGLEDMHLAQRLLGAGYKIGYVSEASVYHLHDEQWGQVKRRFEREAIALQHIMPEVHISFADFIRYFSSAALLDASVALEKRQLGRLLGEILAYRFSQYWGSYRGNHIHRKLSKSRKEAYFFPR